MNPLDIRYAKNKLAFCFLIKKNIEHEDLWKKFFDRANRQKYNIYIHNKPSRRGKNHYLKHFGDYILEDCIPTAWSSVSLVKAQNLMLEAGLEDENNTHFIFLSGSCIPLKGVEHIFSYLDINKSYFNIFKSRWPKDKKAKQAIDRIKNTGFGREMLDTNEWGKYIAYHSQWCILCRKHAELLTCNDEYLQWFDFRGQAPDEHCYLTYLQFHHLHNETIVTDHASNSATTFTNWPDMEYRQTPQSHPGEDKRIEWSRLMGKRAQSIHVFGPHPRTYSSIGEKSLKYLLESPCLFGRKFDDACNLDIIPSYFH